MPLVRTPLNVSLRTWIELDIKALHHNLKRFWRIIKPETKLMAVVKSNAYGHGLAHIAPALLKDDNFKKRGWFGVDSITEGRRLRQEGIEAPILILGYTLPRLFREAKSRNLVVSLGDFNSLQKLGKLKERPDFFIKIDTGLHRRGFLPEEIVKLINFLRRKKIKPLGVFSHFASASVAAHRAYSQKQINVFKSMVNKFEQSGLNNLLKSMAATGGALFYPDSHFDMVRIGMGLYGYEPSWAGEQKILRNEIKLKPVLIWKTIVAEVKEIPANSFVGYNLSQKVKRQSKIAILPVGYWHGYDRRFSNKGEVLIRGHRAPVLGLVSMDMIIVDVTEIDKIKIGDEAVLLGRSGRETIWADDLAREIKCSHYELLTRLNPLIKRFET